MKPLLSICTITYNHAAFVAQAIEGFLMQQTDFTFEIVICDDCSTDETASIISAYAERHPELIRFKPQPRNVGMNANFIEALKLCQGKYIALCEGDDYWKDATKLQQQVDFLESHPDYAICFHKAHIQTEVEGYAFPDYNHDTAASTDLNNLILRGNYIHTPTCVFRNHVAQLPGWYSQAMPPDYFLHLHTARNGKIWYMDSAMSVYRVHAGGVWSQHSRDVGKRLRYLSTMRLFLKGLTEHQWQFAKHERYKAIKRDYIFAGMDELKAGQRLAGLKHITLAFALGPGVISFFNNNAWVIKNVIRDLFRGKVNRS